MDWKCISKYHMNPPDIKLKRNEKVLEDYEKYLKTNKNYDISLKQCLFKNNEPYVLTPNKFPYEFKDGTVHYLLWFNPDIGNNKVDYTKILEFFKDFVCFENLDMNKSVKSIPHVHIFIKEKDKKKK